MLTHVSEEDLLPMYDITYKYIGNYELKLSKQCMLFGRSGEAEFIKASRSLCVQKTNQKLSVTLSQMIIKSDISKIRPFRSYPALFRYKNDSEDILGDMTYCISGEVYETEDNN